MALRRLLAAACIGMALAGCGAPASGTADIAALPTAHVITPAAVAQVAPFTSTPALKILIASRPADRPATPTLIVVTALEPTSMPPATATPFPANEPTAALEAMLIVEINKVRIANNLPAYRASPELSAAARAHSCDLATHHMISHVSSDGRNLADRLAASDPAWQWPSESIAAGTADPATVVMWWMDEPPEGWHRRNILDTEQREVGAGYCVSDDDPTGNHSYWTADFSRREP